MYGRSFRRRFACRDASGGPRAGGPVGGDPPELLVEDAEAAPRRVSRHRLVSLFGDADERGVRVCALGQRVTGESLELELRAGRAYFAGTARCSKGG